MSSAVIIDMDKPVTRDHWAKFCHQMGIYYSPCTVGRNVFYLGEVQIVFGEGTYQDVTKGEAAEKGIKPQTLFKAMRPFMEEIDTNTDPEAMAFDTYLPPESATKIVVSSFFGKNLPYIAMVAKMVLNEFGGKPHIDPELQELMS